MQRLFEFINLNALQRGSEYHTSEYILIPDKLSASFQMVVPFTYRKMCEMAFCFCLLVSNWNGYSNSGRVNKQQKTIWTKWRFYIKRLVKAEMGHSDHHGYFLLVYFLNLLFCNLFILCEGIYYSTISV
jgi:ABC-type antimicrobial peptide transport system permease subunit